MSTVLDLAVAYLEVFFSGDVEGAADFLADDFEFDGPLSHYGSAEEFAAGSAPFVAGLRPGWRQVAAFGDQDEALLLYDLLLLDGTQLRVANHLVFVGKKIVKETIVFDTNSLPTSRAKTRP